MKLKKQKILILHFSSLNNYGSGMMGLITIQALIDRFGAENLEIHCDFNVDTNIDEIKSELRSEIVLKRYANEIPAKLRAIKFKLYRRFLTLLYMLFYAEGKGFNRIIVLGGDDLSEYYSTNDAAFDIYNKLKSSFRTRVILLGQSIGPFTHPLNKFAARWFLPHLHVYSRDQHCTEYMFNEFGVRLKQMADLALLDLPLQSDKKIESEILSKYKLIKDEYFCVVVSGLQKDNFFCNDPEVYLQRFKEMVEELSKDELLKDKKICLLAHTFPPYADESILVKKLASLLDKDLLKKVVIVTDRILQARARFILGNGLFTLTARMHPAVSTFQMGKPAICLSYSPKYKGVIGDSIGRYDLVVEANDSKLWIEGNIVDLVVEKYKYMITNYDYLRNEIKSSVVAQKLLVENALNEI
jgi:colanic acid/amylovoran biosynthesis protein